MTHYHEVYFNDHTNDGPRVGATRRTRKQVEQERSDSPWKAIGSAIVRCERPDSQCPWTVEGVPGEEASSLDRPWCITGLELGRRVVQDRYETEDQARKALTDIIGPNRSPQHWTIADLQVEHRPANKPTGGE